jgi:hypothetical protein
MRYGKDIKLTFESGSNNAPFVFANENELGNYSIQVPTGDVIGFFGYTGSSASSGYNRAIKGFAPFLNVGYEQNDIVNSEVPNGSAVPSGSNVFVKTKAVGAVGGLGLWLWMFHANVSNSAAGGTSTVGIYWGYDASGSDGTVPVVKGNPPYGDGAILTTANNWNQIGISSATSANANDIQSVSAMGITSINTYSDNPTTAIWWSLGYYNSHGIGAATVYGDTSGNNVPTHMIVIEIGQHRKT